MAELKTSAEKLAKDCVVVGRGLQKKGTQQRPKWIDEVLQTQPPTSVVEQLQSTNVDQEEEEIEESDAASEDKVFEEASAGQDKDKGNQYVYGWERSHRQAWRCVLTSGGVPSKKEYTKDIFEVEGQGGCSARWPGRSLLGPWGASDQAHVP